MKSNLPLVSIIMNCYNGEKYLNAAIESVIAQTYRNFEIIFWDNKSVDKSAEIIHSYQDSRIKYFLGAKHVSLGEARNLALDVVSGDYICFLDVDDLWVEDKLELQIKQMTNNEKLIVSYSYSYEFYNENLNSKIEKSFIEQEHENIFFSLMQRNYINWQTVMIKRNKNNNYLRFDKQFEFLEDLDILLLLSLKGEFGLIKKPLVYYRKHDSNLSLKEHDMLRERFFILKKYKKYFGGNKLTYYGIYLRFFLIFYYKKLFVANR